MKKILASLLAVVVLLAVMVTPVMADDTVITGTVPEAIEVAAPAGFAMPSLNPADSQPITSSAQTATIDANHTGWTLTVVEAGGTPDGKMSGTPGTLTNVMQVQGGDQTTPASLASAVTLESDGAAGGGQTISDISFQQTVSWDDVAGDYSITVTFTATPGS